MPPTAMLPFADISEPIRTISDNDDMPATTKSSPISQDPPVNMSIADIELAKVPIEETRTSD
jgi:hypothetical protein